MNDTHTVSDRMRGDSVYPVALKSSLAQRLSRSAVMAIVTSSLALNLGACSLDTPRPSTEQSSTAFPTQPASAAPSSAATTQATPQTPFAKSALLGADAWWKLHPDLKPETLADADLLLEKAGNGTATFPVTPKTGTPSKFAFVMICDASAPYSISFNGKDETSGSSCGGPNIATYTTASQEVASTSTVTATVPAGVNYVITVYQIQS